MLRIVAALLVVIGLVGCSIESDGIGQTGESDQGLGFVAAQSDADFAALLNPLRANAGLPAAVADARLFAAAQAFADDMVARDYFSHTTPDGGTLGSRLAAAGFSQCGAAENIAFGNSSPAGAFNVWMESGPHRSNLLFTGNVAFGIGHAGDKTVLIVARPC